MNHLPAEVLVQILSVVQSDKPWLLPHLRLVCRAWNDMVEGSPRFWANVVSNVWRVPLLPATRQETPRDSLVLLNTYRDALKRSEPYFLTVALDLTRNVSLDKQNLISTLAPHSPRLVSLSIILSTSHPIFEFHQLLERDLNSLEDLTVMLPTGTTSSPSIPNSFVYHHTLPPSALPRLRNLRIAAVFLGLYLARPSLKHLSVYAPSGISHMRLDHWGLVICVLQDCRSLETLEIIEALPLISEPYDPDLWSNSGNLSTLRSCIIKDTPDRVARFATLLRDAPVPTDADLNVTLTPPASDIAGTIMHPRLFSLAFHRFLPGEVGRVEIDSTLRVYAGDRKCFEFAMAPALQAELVRGLPFAVLVTASRIGPDGPRTKKADLLHGVFSPNIQELRIRLAGDPPVGWWVTLLRLFRHLRRLEVRLREITSLVEHLRSALESKKSTLGAVEELVLLGVRVTEEDQDNFARSFVSAFSSCKSAGLWAPRRCVLRYRGRRLPVFERLLTMGLADVIDDLVVYSS
ncbi:hypothetical protein K466DRAFT_594461 [Polyporus arcularius HHB13444]|uniref:F-box domain-containing protein n=1 Tax=Polyporus arcularius HHB13444 TaxID=1314778 RepID=A0A5C3PZQ0_9APHY|nr:hypothetical protein K466DRAFT_594461 [Polyporus arcularius HHB13444]